MNIALDGETPYDNHDLFRYLQKHMNVMKSTTRVPWTYLTYGSDGRYIGNGRQAIEGNSAFYTTDGIRFEFWAFENYCTPDAASPKVSTGGKNYLHESGEQAHMCTAVRSGEINPAFKCGSYGLAYNPNNLTATPCIIAVDVNGDRKPFPQNVSCTDYDGCVETDNHLMLPNPNSKKVNDIFSVIITEDRAIPFGVLAQKAMYQAQK